MELENRTPKVHLENKYEETARNIWAIKEIKRLAPSDKYIAKQGELKLFITVARTQ